MAKCSLLGAYKEAIFYIIPTTFLFFFNFSSDFKNFKLIDSNDMYNMDESQKHYAQLIKEARHKRPHTIYDSI